MTIQGAARERYITSSLRPYLGELPPEAEVLIKAMAVTPRWSLTDAEKDIRDLAAAFAAMAAEGAAPRIHAELVGRDGAKCSHSPKNEWQPLCERLAAAAAAEG
jgi:hypothetical protein